MTTLTLSTVVIILYGVLGSGGYGRALALGGATAAGAALVVGTTAVPTFYAVALGAVVALGLPLLGPGPRGPRRQLPPGVPVLLLFLAWSALVTLVAPVLFNGLGVPTPGGLRRLAAGFVTSSNIAQLSYLFLGICVVIFLARSSAARPELIGLAAGTTTLLSLWRTLHELVGVPFPEGVFDNSPFFAYIETAPGGTQRYRGILSEPSGLAGTSLVTAAYMLSRAAHVRGLRRAGTLAVAAIAAYLGTISTSATFVVAAGAVALLAGMTFAVGFLLRRTSISAVVSVAGCVLAVVAVWVLPIVAEFAEARVSEKVGSASFSERSGADARGYDILVDTYGLGVGLGAARASSFLPGLLATTGIVGTLLFAAAVAGLIRRTAALPEYRPVIWALVTLLVTKVVAGPDLSDSSGVMWMSLGLLSHAVLTLDRRRPAAPPFLAGDTGPPARVRQVTR